MQKNWQKISVDLRWGAVTALVLVVLAHWIAGAYQDLRRLRRTPFLLRDAIVPNFENIKAKAYQRTLLAITPDFNGLPNLIREKRPAQEFAPYLRYYRKLAEYFPQLADAHGLLGFFYFQSGQMEQARRSYQKAMELNPDFFYFAYNLGVIHAREGKNAVARQYFAEALRLPPEDTIRTILSSKVYQQVRPVSVYSANEIIVDLKQGYESCARAFQGETVVLQIKTGIF